MKAYSPDSPSSGSEHDFVRDLPLRKDHRPESWSDPADSQLLRHDRRPQSWSDPADSCLVPV